MNMLNFRSYCLLCLILLTTQKSLFSQADQDSIEYYFSKNLDRSIYFNEQLIKKSKSTEINAQYNSNRGVIMESSGKVDSAIFYYELSQSSDRIYRKTKLRNLNQLGIIYSNIGDYEKSTQLYLKGLRLSEESNDSLNIFNFLINLGVVYYYKENFSYASEKYERALEIAKKIENPNFIINAKKNLADLSLEKKNYEASISAYNLIINDTTVDLSIDLQININNSLGVAYMDDSQITKSKLQFEKCILLAKEHNFNSLLGTFYMNLGDSYYLSENYSDCKKNYDLADSCFKTNPSIENESNLQKKYADFYYKTNDLELTYSSLRNYIDTRNNIFKKRDSDKIEYFEKKYEKEKKDKEIQLLAKDNQILSQESELLKIETSEYKFLIALVIGVALFLSIIAGFIIWSLRQRRKKQLLFFQKRELEKELELKQFQYQLKIDKVSYELDAEERERTRIASELHDGIGSALAGLKMQLSTLNSNSNLSEEVNLIYQEVRQIAHNLSAPIISDPDSLLLALKILVNRYLETNKIKTKIIWFPENQMLQLSKEKEMALLRIFQELFANILNHSQANFVEIQIYLEDNNVSISVEDNGVGRNKITKNTSSFGINSIEKRIQFLEGSINWESNKSGFSTHFNFTND